MGVAEDADRNLSWLFKQLQEFPTVSAWCGPSFEYDPPYHDLLDLSDPARGERLRRRSLVAMLLTCLGPIEEHYGMGLASDLATCKSRLAALEPRDDDERRLISIVTAAFDAVPRREELDDTDVFAIDRDARWVHARYVLDALEPFDATTGDPPAIPPALRALAAEVAAKIRP